MNAKTAIKTAIDTANMIATSYLGDLSDEEMMHRPDPSCNHIKWQIGHLIVSEYSMINQCFPGSMPELPDGFAEKYTKETAGSDDPATFDTKNDLLELHRQQRAATMAVLEKTSDDELNQECPEEMRAYAPTFGSAFLMQDVHWMMHAGQWAVIRRQLGRAPLF